MNKFRKAIMTAAIAAAGAAAFASVGARDAESIAIEHSGVRNARFVHTDRDRDHGRTIWEVEFYDGDREYSYDIDAETGDIIKADWDLDWWDRAGDQISEDDALRSRAISGDIRDSDVSEDLSRLGGWNGRIVERGTARIVFRSFHSSDGGGHGGCDLFCGVRVVSGIPAETVESVRLFLSLLIKTWIWRFDSNLSI